jgi:conjugal transfer/entry exclusion protein
VVGELQQVLGKLQQVVGELQQVVGKLQQVVGKLHHLVGKTYCHTSYTVFGYIYRHSSSSLLTHLVSNERAYQSAPLKMQ